MEVLPRAERRTSEYGGASKQRIEAHTRAEAKAHNRTVPEHVFEFGLAAMLAGLRITGETGETPTDAAPTTLE